MIIQIVNFMHQQKKNNPSSLRGTVDPRETKNVGRKINKVKQIKSKIFKNLSQFPIQLNNPAKQNQPNNQVQRPNSSLLVYENNFQKANRIESALSQYPDNKEGNNRKRLSLDSTGKKHERDSLISRNSMSKKMSRNNKSIEDGLRTKMLQERRRSNVSCLSMNDQARTTKKHSCKQKRPSVSNLHLMIKQKEKEGKSIKQAKGIDKSRSKSQKARRKSTVQLDKSKTSTTVVGALEKGFTKKKQSSSTAYIGSNIQKKKKKVQKKKSERMQISHGPQQLSIEQYPISKYDAWSKSNKICQPMPLEFKKRSKSKSKSRKGSLSKQRKKATSMLEIDYISCMNIPSNSSGLINSRHSNESQDVNSKIKIIDNWEYQYVGQQNTSSVDLEEIRYFQSYHDTKNKKEEIQFMNRNFRNQIKYKNRRIIQEQIQQQYPHFDELQLKFVASVIFIQRKWREFRLYKEIFQKLGHSPQKISQFSFEQSNSKQLNISTNHNKSPQKTIQNLKQKDSSQQPKNDSSSPSAYKSNLSQTKQKIIAKDFGKSLSNNIYLREYQQQKSSKKNDDSNNKMKQQYSNQSNNNSQEKNITSRSDRYQFLQKELFPSMSYLFVKQQQLKQELYSKICQYNELQRNGVINAIENQKLRENCQSQFKRDMFDLNKSRKDIKKGYLSFIDTCKNIKQENGLRRVSSERGPMAELYFRIFNLDLALQTPSESSESMKRLTKRVLIRREFFQSQKAESNLIHAVHQSSLSARQKIKNEQPSSLSARLFTRRELVNQGEESNDMTLGLHRIREGVMMSPQLVHRQLTIKPVQLIVQKNSNKQIQQFNRKILKEQRQNLIFEDVIATLTHELFVQLVRIDERRQNVIDILSEGNQAKMTKIKTNEISDCQIIEETISVELQKQQKDQDFQIVEQSKFRQIYKIEGLADKTQTETNRKHRNSNTYNISPATSQPIQFQTEEILTYGRELFAFLKKIKMEEQIIIKLNKNLGFTAQEYLKFLRDFQIPDQQYEPLISNQIFMEWEDHYYHQHLEIIEKQGYMKRQTAAIFHRCVFQCIIGLLEEYRPCGDKGQPFPWENVMFFRHSILIQKIDLMFTDSLKKLEKLVHLRCGIIDEKHILFSQDDMERVHEQNEDKIIYMLEQELALSPHDWYQVEQHCLQVKLQIEGELFQYIMLQALDQLLQLL